MKHHHNVPQTFSNVGKSCPNGLQPLLSYQGHTSLKSSSNVWEFCAGRSEVRVGPNSSSLDFGFPILLICFH